MEPVKVGSLRDPDDCRRAAQLMHEGSPVGVFGRSVASIWVDATNTAGVAAVYRIKGAKRTGMPLGMALAVDDLPRLIDPDLIAPELRPLLLDGSDLAARLSTLIWIRFPLRRVAVAALPECLMSNTPDGTRWGQGWITDLGDAHGVLLARLAENGIRLIAPTSMNVSGEPEIVDVEVGAEFCARHGIPLFLRDPDDARAVQGSYPIMEVNRDGVRLVREGHFPSYLLSRLLGGVPVQTEGHRPAKYPVLQTHTQEEAQKLSAYRLHDEIQAALNKAARHEQVGKRAGVLD
jgi:hypothetical protein